MIRSKFIEDEDTQYFTTATSDARSRRVFLLSFFARGTAGRREKMASATSTRKTRTRRAADAGRGRDRDRRTSRRRSPAGGEPRPASAGRRADRAAGRAGAAARGSTRPREPDGKTTNKRNIRSRYTALFAFIGVRDWTLRAPRAVRTIIHRRGPCRSALTSDYMFYALLAVNPPQAQLAHWRPLARREILGSHVQMLEHGGSCLEKTELP